MPRRSGCVPMLCLLALLAVGCGSGGNQAVKPVPPTTRTPTQPPNVDNDPRLVRAGSPGATVLELFRYVRQGAVPLAALLYDPAVRDATGLADFAGGLAWLQQDVAASAPKIVSDESADAGRLLTVSVVMRGKPAVENSYVLRRRGTGWVVVFDTMLSRAISSYAAARASGSKAPNDAGTAAAERFRIAAVTVVTDAARRRASDRPAP